MSRKKKQRKKLIPKNEFRYNFTEQHKSYVFGEIGDEYRSVGLTHRDTTFGIKNMPLKNNPQKHRTEQSNIRNGIVSDKKVNYSKRTIKNLLFTHDDFANVKSKIRNYKKRQKRQRKSK